jgi:hypothetical protein
VGHLAGLDLESGFAETRGASRAVHERRAGLALGRLALERAAACDRDRDPDYGADTAPADVPGLPAEPITPAPTMPEPAPPPIDSGMTFVEMDRNSDGGITREELDAGEMLYQHFDVADTNGDGVLSQAEVDARLVALGLAPVGARTELTVGSSRPAARDELEGVVIGGHRLLSRLGAGGMGVVHRAEQVASGARRAVKVFPGGSASAACPSPASRASEK